MKRNFINVIVLLMLFGSVLSCKKSSGGGSSTAPPTGPYYINFTFGGNTYSFVDTVEGFITPGPPASCTMEASEGKGYGAIVVQVQTSPFGTSFDTNTTYISPDVNFVLEMIPLEYQCANLTNSNSQVNFTTITSTYVKGTFSGYVATDTGPAIAVTNGSFYVQIVP